MNCDAMTANRDFEPWSANMCFDPWVHCMNGRQCKLELRAIFWAIGRHEPYPETPCSLQVNLVFSLGLTTQDEEQDPRHVFLAILSPGWDRKIGKVANSPTFIFMHTKLYAFLNTTLYFFCHYHPLHFSTSVFFFFFFFFYACFMCWFYGWKYIHSMH